MALTKDIQQEVESIFSGSGGCHDFEHTLRVYNLCLRIGKKEKANLEILKIAALLHDIGRPEQNAGGEAVCHAKEGAKKARKILKEHGLPKAKIDSIVHCISTHRHRGGNEPQSLEAKILFDADKLDAIGAVGIGRAFLFAGEIKAKLHNDKETRANIRKTSAYTKEDTAFREFEMKLRHIKNNLYTSEGRKIAEERHKFMEKFFDRLNKEADGKS